MDERRTEPRFAVHWKAVIAGGGHVFEAHTEDISSGGMTLLSPNRLDEGAHCKVQFSIPGPQKGTGRLVQAEMLVTNVVLAAHMFEFRLGAKFLNLGSTDRLALESFLKEHFPTLSGGRTPGFP